MDTLNGINYNVTDVCIVVYDSWKITKKEFKQFLTDLRSIDGDLTVLKKRSDCSLSNEWATHTFLYKCHIARSHTKDVDMQYPLTWWEKILYPCVGWFCKIWIK